jgi:hypothetical protein
MMAVDRQSGEDAAALVPTPTTGAYEFSMAAAVAWLGRCGYTRYGRCRLIAKACMADSVPRESLDQHAKSKKLPRTMSNNGKRTSERKILKSQT